MKKGVLFILLIAMFVLAFVSVANAAYPSVPTVWNFEKDFDNGGFLDVTGVTIPAGTYNAPGYTGVTYATDQIYDGPALDVRGRVERIWVSQYQSQPYNFGAAGSAPIYTPTKVPSGVQGFIGDAAWVAANSTRFAEVDAAGAWGKPWYKMSNGPAPTADPHGNYVYLQWWAVDAENPGNLVDVTANTGSPHGGFTTTSIKCAVCHSVHTAAPAQSAAAPVADTLLRMKAADACGYCHVSKGNTVGNPIWGGDVRALAGANGHALGNNCDECHTSVHGGGAETEVASLEGKLLTLGTDYGTGSPGGNTTVLSRVAVINAKAVEQGFSNPTGFSVADYQTKYEADAPGITAQAVGVFCGGCHDASYSLAVSGASASTFGGQSSGMFSGHLSKGASVAGSSWNPVAGCTSCHDASDGFGGFAFPHNWGTTGEEAVIGPDGKTYENQTMGWLLVSEFAGAPKAVNGGPEGKLGHAGPDGGTLADGVCLKCHRGSAVTGVGLDF
jgi:hypothetical protein